MIGSIRSWSLGYLARSDAAESGDDNSLFWSRRYFTSLAVGNAAGALALGSFLGSEDSGFSDVANLITPAFCFFSLGLLLAGLIPLGLWIRYSYDRPQERVSPSPTITADSTQVTADSTNVSTDGRQLPEFLGYKHPIFWALFHKTAVNLAFVFSTISTIFFAIALYNVNIDVIRASIMGNG